MKNNLAIDIVDPLDSLVGNAYQGDIGIDIRAASDPVIAGHNLRENEWKHIDYIEYDTNIKISASEESTNEFGIFLFPRSSISRFPLSLCNSVGVIDHGYRDTIKVRFKYLPQPSDYIVFEKWLILRPDMARIYKLGDKIAQLVFLKTGHPSFNKVDFLKESERGINSFGSSGS
jgi:dUTPase